jgi:hypothetical protein
MTNLNDMSPEEVRAHFERINSPEFEAQMLAQLEEEERIRKSVTEEEAARRYMPPVVLDEVGTLRFRENPLITAMLKSGSRRGDPKYSPFTRELRRMLDPKKGNAIVQWISRSENLGKVDMNEIAEHGGWTQEEQECFAMLIGYSVSGAGDLSYFSDAMWERAWVLAEPMLEGAKG